MPHNTTIIPITVELVNGQEAKTQATWGQILGMLESGLKVTVFIPSQNRTLNITETIARNAFNTLADSHISTPPPPPPSTPPPSTPPPSNSPSVPPVNNPPPPGSNNVINTSMVSQSIGGFQIKDGRVLGEILFIAEQSFNDFYFGHDIISIIEIRDQNNVPLVVKTNRLNFTSSQRDERINIDENAFNNSLVHISSVVFLSVQDAQAFSTKKTFEAKILQPGEEPDFEPPGTNQSLGEAIKNNPLGFLAKGSLMIALASLFIPKGGSK